MLNADLLFGIEKAKQKEKWELWYEIVARMYLDGGAEALPYLKDFRRVMVARMNAAHGAGAYPFLLRKSYILTARDRFEDFMIAMEWDRSPNARFWMPRRRVLEGQHHIATALQRFIDDPHAHFLSISFPPGTGKSTLIKFLLAYIAGKYPDSCNMYISYGSGMVNVMYASVFSMLTDSEYNFKEIFPDVPTLKTSAEYSTLSFRPDGTPPTLGLVAMGGAVTGRTRANKFFVTDDLVKNEEVARSPERLENLYDDYNATLTTRQIGDDVKEIMLGTVWARLDPISRKREENEGQSGYYFIAIPVCDENGHSNFLYDHPDRYSDKKIAEIKRKLPDDVFSALYMQRGVEKAGMAFSTGNLKFYNGVLPDGDPVRVFACDVAWGGGDSLSMPIAYVYDSGEIYIADVLFDRGDKSVTKPRVISKILQHKLQKGRFEANTGGEEYADDINRQLREDHKYFCSITSKKAPTNKSKLVKIEQYQDAIKTFYFLDMEARSKNPDYQRFMNELTTFSFTSKNLHDDAADSLAQLADYVLGNGGRAKVEVRARAF